MKRTNRGFTLIELLVVIAIVGVLMALIAPAIASTREKATIVSCMNNLKNIGMAAFMYADDHNEVIPDVPDTVNYTQNTENVYKCPRDMRPDVGISKPSYTAWKYTPASLLLGDIKGNLSEKLLYVESDLTNKNDIDDVNKLALRHDGRTVVVFADGHIFSYSEDQFSSLHGLGDEDVPLE